MPGTSYEGQDRGSLTDYQRYLEAMDASMRQKVALTAAHLLCLGKVADMGMGSGTGSQALASLYPELEVVGVDVNPTMVELARERHRLPNLSFVLGDVAERVFPEGSLDGILDSSVLHHVTSFTGYSQDAARRALANQVAQLALHGVLVVRDFVSPGDRLVLLDLPTTDGGQGDDPSTSSSAALFVRFAREFRPLSSEPGFDYRAVEPGPDDPPLAPGFRRFSLSHKHAAEFVLRKDYRADWESELKEEYTYFTQAEFEAEYARLGLRLLASTPLYNPWIVRNRYQDKLALHDAETGRRLEPPPTNFLISGERVAPGEGVRMRERARVGPLGFLELEQYRDRRSGKLRDLVRRPHLTVDAVPWFRHGGSAFVLARMSYPRPLLSAELGARPLDGSRFVHYVTEPLAVLQADQPIGQTVEHALVRDAGLRPDQLLGFAEGTTYYPSPGGVAEEVRSAFVEIAPVFVRTALPGRSGFTTSGRVRAIEARQLLRAAQVDALPDARLELNVYDLLARLGIGCGPWIGEELQLREAGVAVASRLHDRPARRVFERVEAPIGPRFLELACSEFEELDASGRVLATRSLEYVMPVPLGPCTAVAAVLRRCAGELLLGIDDDDLPAAQCFTGNSNLWVTPAWRLPRQLGDLTAARSFVVERLRAEYGIDCGGIWTLGGRYHPSAGATPEVAYPMAVEVLGERAGPRALTWVRLDELVEHSHRLQDGHLRLVALRAAHALGQLP